MTKRIPPAKSRKAADRPRVTIAPRRDDAAPPGYSGHTGGSFAEAGYTAGRGQFGFRHNAVSSHRDVS